MSPARTELEMFADAEVSKLSLKPGELLILKVPRGNQEYALDMAKALYASVKAAGIQPFVLVLDNESSIETMKREEALAVLKAMTQDTGERH